MTRVSPGSPLFFPADHRNKVLDTVEFVDGLRRSGFFNPTRMGGDRDVVLVRNDSGAAIKRFGVLGLDGPIIEPTDNEKGWKNGVAFKGITPTIADHQNTFVVTLTPLGVDKTGFAVVSGVVNVKLSVTDDTDEVAGVDDGESTHLITGTGTTIILWKDIQANEDVDGRRWGTVLFGGSGGEEITVVTDFQVSGVTLQIKTRTVLVMPTADESAWTTVHTGTECP